MSLIELADLHKTYKLGEVNLPVLKGISLDIDRGEYVALMGASGSGKTTLMNLLGGLDQADRGSYRLDGVEMLRRSGKELARIRSEQVGFVFQSFNLLARVSALENVMMPTLYSRDRPSLRQTRRQCRELLEGVGLGKRLHHSPAQLSGGEQQRVAIARALVNGPSLLLADEPTGNLDSKTGADILELFRRLNQEHGLTILMVTHDEDVARHADRVVRIVDGRIVSDERVEHKAEVSPATAEEPLPALPEQKRRWGRSLRAARHLVEGFRIALSALRRNVLRTTLTMLGVIIGVAAVVAVMEVSKGASDAILQTVTNLGTNIVTINPGSISREGVSLGGGSAKTLTPDDAQAVARQCPTVAHTAPIVWARPHLIRGNRNWEAGDFVGTTPDFFTIRNWNDLQYGRIFTQREIRSVRKVCLIGDTVMRELFGEDFRPGAEIRVNNVPFQVIGVLSEKGSNLLGRDMDDIVVAPWTTVKFRVEGADDDEVTQSIAHNRHVPPESTRALRITNLDQVLVQSISAETVPVTIEQVTELLRARHRIGGGEDDFKIRDLTEVVRVMNHLVRLLSSLILMVAGFALLVGGVGIMNIMLVSVVERTREIGLRMAVGANAGDVLRQFLAEAVVICILGGLIGIVAGHGVTLLIGKIMHWPAPTSVAAAIVAITVSFTIGVIFGYYPAWKASRLNPIDALRYE